MKKAATQLQTYRAKRDFTKTREPSGARKVLPAEHLRFVIQKHAASHLHYDLRLELNGVFKSWAVTKGPSIDPADKRLAVEVEDHPLDYGDFEGTIPKGEYGGGTVQMWDRGYWAPQGPKKPEDALNTGELKFVLAGQRLSGSWVLVRIRNNRGRDTRTNWLLIKHQDEYAVPGGTPALIAEDRSVASGRSMDQIARGAGKAPRPFMLAKAAGAAAVWRSNRAQGDGEAGVVSRPASTRRPAVTLSKPAKVLWPATDDSDAVTKRDLAEYYETVGEWLLPHLRGRPCSLLRAPDGITGEQFFQRHAMAGISDSFTLVKIKDDKSPYVQIDQLETLIAVAQIGALEMHPWNCAEDNPEVAGRLVFDLDPAPEVKFSAVIAAGLEVRDRLKQVGLESFCKTTGGKGLHVVTPLTGGKDAVAWPAAKNFAHIICAQMARDSPAKYVDTMSKKERVGRIFLDYLRNDRTSTAVAVLSTRARPGAPVSMPIHWKEVKATLKPARYDIRTAPRILATSKPWSDYGKSARSLSAAIEKVLSQASPVKRVNRKQ